MTAIEIDAPAEDGLGARRLVQRHHRTAARGTSAPGLRIRCARALEGSGVGAVRHCEFTTGAFVEPITVWDAPRTAGLRRRSRQPPPLQEWSPYSRVYAPHLDGFFRTSHGEFRLVAPRRRRTRLEGRTWYILDMQPAMYWNVVADTILHAIHHRVLEHVKARLSEDWS